MCPYYIGLDGGGTGTEGVLTDSLGRVLSVCCTGPSNPNDLSLTTAAQVLSGCVRTLLSRAPIPVSLDEVILFGGVSGALGCREALREAVLHELPSVGRAEIHTDAVNILSADIPDGDGACIICGTGSVCFLRHGSAWHRIGGWGYLLDSAGSGYDIGRQALEAVLRACDGRGEPTCLTDFLREIFHGDVSDHIADIYRGGKPTIAACVPAVFAASALHDRIASDILDRNARAVAEYIETAFRWLSGMTPDSPACFPVVLNGGIFRHEGTEWKRRIEAQMSRAVPAVLTVSSHPPLLGAVTEAFRLGQASSVLPADRTSFRHSFLATFPLSPEVKTDVL